MQSDGLRRVVAGAATSLTFQGVDGDGEPADPGVVTVGIVNSAGTVVKAPGTATTGTGTDERAAALAAADTASLDVFTATWKVATTTVAVTRFETVGSLWMTSTQIRNAEPSLSDPTKYPAAAILAARNAAIAAIEEECRRAFAPRFKVAVVEREGILPDDDIRTVRTVTRVSDGQVLVAGTDYFVNGRIIDLGCVAWPFSPTPTWTVGYEYGRDAPPLDLLEVFPRIVRYRLNMPKTGVPDRALSYQPAEGGNVVIATPGLGPWIYGVPDVDAVIMRHRWGKPAVA